MALILILGILGVICVGLEVFLPGGVLGIIGALAMLASIYFAYHNYNISGALLTLIALVVIAIISYNMALKLAPKTRLGRSLFLSQTQKGVNVSRGEMEKLEGREGKAVSELRPTGTAIIDGKRVTVMTQGEFIEENSPVKVIAIKNNQLIVEKVS